MSSLRACPTIDRDPRILVIAADSRLKFSVTLNQPKTVLHCRSCLSASREVSCFRKVVVSELAPPDVLNTRGVNEDFTTFNTFLCTSFVLPLHVNSSK